MNRKIIIGSRGSDLALWQAHFVSNQLTALGVNSEIQIIKTQGDKIQHLSFDKMEGKGFFTKEIEEALLNRHIDLAIHSHKDLETNSPNGLKIGAVSYRENPAEWLLIRKESLDYQQSFNLKKGATLGTSAARRKSQFTFYRPDVNIKDLRGNVPTRVDKLRQGHYDAILLAAAGVSRLKLDLSEFEVVELDPRVFIPAPAQGVLAYQIREEDIELEDVLNKLNDTNVATTIGIERKILNLLHGGCQVPFGAYCKKEGEGVHLWAYYGASEEQKRRLYLHSTKNEIDFDRVLSKLRDKNPKSVLITRQLSENIGTKKMLQDAGVNVSDVSFIRIELVEHQWKANFDWLFFTSPNAIEHFNALDRIPSGIKIGALGRGTSAALRLKNLSVAFEGDGTTQTVAANFKTVLGQEKALIICAENGLRNFQQGLNPESYQELAVYKTKVNPIKLGEVPPIVAFTSPSNVDGFFALNELPARAKVIAIGTTTQKALAERNVKNVTVAWQSSEQALVDTILGLD